MSLATIGDLSLSTAFLRHSMSLKRAINDRTGEMATGVSSDVNKRLGGNYAALADITRNQIQNRSYKTVSAETATIAAAIQSSLGHIQSEVTDLYSVLLDGSAGNSGIAESTVSDQARGSFSTVVATLNTAVSGRSLFAGASVSQVPLPAADTILAALSATLSGLTDPGDIRSAVDAWFSSGGGFETSVYQGSTTDVASFPISDTRRVDLGLRADDPEIRNVLKETALIALAGDPALGFSSTTASALRSEAGEALLSANDGLTRLRGAVGLQQSGIEEAQASLEAEALSLEGARAELVSADPYDTATRLEEAQFRLEALFSVFSRSASLRLVNFL